VPINLFNMQHANSQRTPVLPRSPLTPSVVLIALSMSASDKKSSCHVVVSPTTSTDLMPLICACTPSPWVLVLGY
jgi:hypothetical protein